MNNVIYYLNLYNPAGIYIYKATEAAAWANCIEFGDDLGSGESFSLANYYRMYDELRDAVCRNETIMRLHAARFQKEAQGYDDDLHILVYDIIYCAYHYHLYRDGMIRTTSTRERIRRAQINEQIEALEAELNSIVRQTAQAEHLCASLPDMTGMHVTHRVFGTGTVISQSGGMQTVTFSAGDKKFQYPAAYTSGFLQADDVMIAALHAVQTAREENAKAHARIKALKAELDKLHASLH